jgi:hypothetical protein
LENQYDLNAVSKALESAKANNAPAEDIEELQKMANMLSGSASQIPKTENTYDFNSVSKALKSAKENNAPAEEIRELEGMVSKFSSQNKRSDFMSQLNRGIATGLGGPVDAVASLLGIGKPFGGKEGITAALNKMNMSTAEEDADTSLGRIAQGMGEATGWALPTGSVIKAAGKGVGLAANVSKEVMQSMAKHPWFSAASELTAGAGMGIGRQIDETHPKMAPYGEITGGLAGGVAPGMLAFAPTRLVYKVGRWGLEKATMPFTKKGTRYRTGRFLTKQTANPEESAINAGKKTISDLPPAIATGDKRLVALYREFSTKDPITETETADRITDSMVTLASKLRKLGKGSPEMLSDVLEKRIATLEISMNKRIVKSMSNAQNSLEDLPVAQRKASESIVVRNSLEKVRNEAHQKVQKIWELVPREIEVPPVNTAKIYRTLLQDSSEAQLEDFPSILKKSSVLMDNPDIPITVNEMQGLRSKLLNIARNARSFNNPNRNLNTARICDEIADAILLDFEPINNTTLKQARAATYNYKNKFEKGIVGKILGADRTSAPSIDPELTLEVAVASNPEAAAVNIEKIAQTPEIKNAVGRYITRSFTDYALDSKTKTLAPLKVEKWLRNNEAVLDQFPELREQFTNAKKAQEIATKTQTLMDARLAKIRNPKISSAASFLDADLGKEIPFILKSKNPVWRTDELVRMASKDPTGNAIEGLRAGFIEHMFNMSSVGKYNSAGQKIVSGNAMNGFLNENKHVLRKVFSNHQLTRIKRIANEYSKLEMYRDKSVKAPKIETEDFVSKVLDTVNRLASASVGRVIAGKTGGGTVQHPSIVIEKTKGILNYFTVDRAKQLLSDAILEPKDGKLLQSLFNVMKPKGKQSLFDLKILERRLNAWLAASGSRVAQDIVQEDKNKWRQHFQTKNKEK